MIQRFILLIAIVLAIVYGVGTFFIKPSGQKVTTQIIVIKPSSTLKSIAKQLKDTGIIESTWKFRFMGRIMGAAKHLKPGEYQFEVPSSPNEVLKILVEGKVLLHRVTIPEGFTMKEISMALENSGLVTRPIFMPFLSRKDLLQKFSVPGKTFEGFLFPDTYYFSKSDDPEIIIKTMTERFKQAITKEDQAKASALGFNLFQWVTLASIVEKESSLPNEQPIIASVFLNRLKKKMRLQSDPTVIYGIPNYDGNIRKVDLLTPTPYNTYTQAGLPPGPIANPGATSLKAVANPAQTKFLYFVGKNDGTHSFSETYEEHAKKVEIFQLKRTSVRASK